MTDVRGQGKTPQAWETFVSACRNNPMNIDLQGVEDILDGLNKNTMTTNYEFYLHQVVDGVVPPNVAPKAIIIGNGVLHDPIKMEKTGPVIQALLDQLPASVRSGTDENYEVYQIRLDDVNSLEHFMGTTVLLTVFLIIRAEGGRCYLLPDDPDSVKNWGVLLDMHAKHFPQLPQGQ